MLRHNEIMALLSGRARLRPNRGRSGTVNRGNQESRFDANGPVLGATQRG